MKEDDGVGTVCIEKDGDTDQTLQIMISGGMYMLQMPNTPFIPLAGIHLIVNC